MLNYSELLKKYPTPFYLFDFDKAISRVKTIQTKLPQNATFCYAIKANPFLLYALKDMDKILFEVCSEGELEICKKLAVTPEKIVFSGVMKNQAMIKKAVDYNVKTITLESIGHLNDLLAILPENKTQEIIIRLSDGSHQFGMSEKDIYETITIINNHKNLILRGIHFFTGTQKKLKKIQEEITFIEDFCTNLKESLKIDFSDIEYGPGLSFDYFSQEDFSQDFNDLETFTDYIKGSTYNYVIELGRFVASPCGEYLTKICDIKTSGENNCIIIDGGINHINYYGQIMAMKVPPLELIHHVETNSSLQEAQDNQKNYSIYGSLCTTADIISKNVTFENPCVEDAILFKNIGAYSITEGIYLFLSHDLPMVLAKQGENIRVLRQSLPTYSLNC